MEEDSSDDDDNEDAPAPMGKPLMAVDAAPAVQQPPAAIPTPGNVEVRKYDPKAKMVKKTVDVTSEQYLVSPITGEKVPASKVQEHMRIGLLDPRWVEERDKQITARATEEQVFAPGQSIENSLKHLAERRTDIFGVGEEAAQEAAIGKKMGEEERRQTEEKITWDGHSSSAEAAARAARANISLNDQIEQIHRSKGLIQDVKDSIGPHSTASVAMTAPPVNVVSVPPQVRAKPVSAPRQLIISKCKQKSPRIFKSIFLFTACSSTGSGYDADAHAASTPNGGTRPTSLHGPRPATNGPRPLRSHARNAATRNAHGRTAQQTGPRGRQLDARGRFLG